VTAGITAHCAQLQSLGQELVMPVKPGTVPIIGPPPGWQMPAVPSKEEWQQARRRSGSPPRNSIYAAVATHWPTANFGGKTQSAAADEYSTPLFSSFGNFKYLNGDGKCQHDETCVTKDMADRTSEVFQAGLQAQPTWQPAGLSMPAAHGRADKPRVCL
jgi:hypothetical protein